MLNRCAYFFLAGIVVYNSWLKRVRLPPLKLWGSLLAMHAKPLRLFFLAGIVVYNSWLKRVRLRPMMLWGSLLGCCLGLTPLLLVEGVNRRLGISDRLFALVDSALLSSVGQVRGVTRIACQVRHWCVAADSFFQCKAVRAGGLCAAVISGAGEGGAGVYGK
jgi:hypothetical protein